MLDYDFVFEKGVLFIALKGNMSKNTGKLFNDEINPLILDNGIKKVVLNISNLSNIDESGIMTLYNSYLVLNKETNVSITGIPYYIKDKLYERKDHIYY